MLVECEGRVGRKVEDRRAEVRLGGKELGELGWLTPR